MEHEITPDELPEVPDLTLKLYLRPVHGSPFPQLGIEIALENRTGARATVHRSNMYAGTWNAFLEEPTIREDIRRLAAVTLNDAIEALTPLALLSPEQRASKSAED